MLPNGRGADAITIIALLTPEGLCLTSWRCRRPGGRRGSTKCAAHMVRIDAKDVKLPLHFGQIRLDLGGDGKAGPDETLWKLYAQLNAAAQNQVTAEASREAHQYVK